VPRRAGEFDFSGCDHVADTIGLDATCRVFAAALREQDERWRRSRQFTVSRHRPRLLQCPRLVNRPSQIASTVLTP
jgi:hypothetical protein